MAKSIVDILVSRGVLDFEEAGKVKKEAKDKNLSTEDILYARGIKEADVAESKAELSGHPVRYLQGTQVPFEALHDIPEDSARHYKIVPLGRKEGYLEVGILNPEDVDAAEALKFLSARLELPVRVFVITPSDFDTILGEYKSLSGEVTKA